MRGVMRVMRAHRTVRRSLLVAGLAATALLSPTGVVAQSDDSGDDVEAGELDVYAPVAAQRRSGFTVGVNLGLMVGDVSGFPADFDKVGVAEHEVDTGAVATLGANAWIGGALQDWFTFGLGGTGVGLSGNGLDASGGAFLVHIEVFPFFPLGGGLRDLGFAANFGVGGMTIERAGKERAQGSGMSVVGAGVFWEALSWGGLNVGPSAEYLHMTMRNITLHAGQVGLRVAWYGGP